jgi:hypothetical protein
MSMIVCSLSGGTEHEESRPFQSKKQLSWQD